MMHEILKLKDYIKKYFNGCDAEFARSCDKKPQHIYRQLKTENFWVVNDKVMQIKYKVPTVNLEDEHNG